MSKTQKPDPDAVVVFIQKKESNNQEQKLIIHPREPLEGRDEMNLVELPFSLVDYRKSQSIKTIESYWQGKSEDGKLKDFYKIVTGSDKWGLPTFRAEEVVIAALELTYRQDFKQNKVHTTKYELLSLMKWPVTGYYRNLLMNTFAQLRGVTIKTNHFWDKREQKYREVVFGIISNASFYEDEKKRGKTEIGQLTLPLGFFTWDEIFWKSLQAGYIKRLDTGTYFSLNSNLARRFYRYADKHLKNGGVEIDLFRLAFDKLVMTGNYRYPSKVMEKLQSAIDELNGRGLVKIRIVKSKTKSGYKVVIGRTGKAPRRSEKSQEGTGERNAQKDALDDKNEANKRLLEQEERVGAKASSTNHDLKVLLTKRDVGEKVAFDLVEKYPDRIKFQVEVFDWIQKHRPDRISKNPAGFLRRMLEENWSPPDGFKTKAECEEDTRRAKEKKKRIDRHYNKKKFKEWQTGKPEDKIRGDFILWESRFRVKYGRRPTQQEAENKRQGLLAELPKIEARKRADLLGNEEN